MLVSFIVPAYNASKTIIRCLNSIYTLPLKADEFEVILIDDASTDDTVSIVNDYAETHNNIVIIKQEYNHRQGAARNRGIKTSKGNYIVFVDSDDETCAGILAALHKAYRQKLEIVCIHCQKVSQIGEIQDLRLSYASDSIFSGIQLQVNSPFWATAPWAYIFEKEFLYKVNYPFAEDVIYEDSDFVANHLYHASKVGYSDECGYRMHYNENSTTHTMSYKHLCDYALLGTRMLQLYSELEGKPSTYASSILEGGSYNIMIAFKKLWRLGTVRQINAFYNRFDSFYNRKSLQGYREPSYCWTFRTRLGISSPFFTIIMNLPYLLWNRIISR